MNKKRKQTRKHTYESLESRQVLSANPIVSLTDGQLNIFGTESRDVVQVLENGSGQLDVHVQAVGQSVDSYQFESSDVDKVYFAGRGGHDYFANRTSISATAYGNDGDDTLVGGSADDTLRGGYGNDVIKGHAGDDSLHGDRGNDRIYGYAGNDRILGWYGDDILVGNDGDDYVSGYHGNDFLWGNDGDDTVKGHEGDDRLRGGEGDDDVYGWKGNDRIFGEGGNDYLSGYTGDDVIFGGSGDDVIKGHEGNDRLFAGEGDDMVYAWKGNDIVNGGDGDDEVWGGDDNDLLVGMAGNDILHGDQGDDQLYGGEGDDILVGFYGNDRLVGASGADMLCGGFDQDTYIQVSAEDVGYDPDGDFVNTPGNDWDNKIEEHVWNRFDQMMEEFQQESDRVSEIVEKDMQDEDAPFTNDPSQPSKLYFNDSNGRLSSFDAETGEYQFIGQLAFKLTDIAMSSTGEMYGVSFNSLYKVNAETAEMAFVGRMNRGDINALTFTEDGQLLAAGFAGSHVYSVGLDNASLTSIGTYSGRSSGDLAFHNDQLFVTTTNGKLRSLDFDGERVTGSSYVANVSSLTYGLATQADKFYATINANVFEVADNGSFTSVANLASSGVGQIWGATQA